MVKFTKLKLVGVVLLIAGSMTAYASATATPRDDDQDKKVTLCHLTSSKTNPFVIQTVNANEVKSHEANGDFIYIGPVDQHGHGDPTWCENNQPGDVCPNIDGKQTAVPDGDILQDGKCVAQSVTPPTPPTPPVTPPTDQTPPVDQNPVTVGNVTTPVVDPTTGDVYYGK